MFGSPSLKFPLVKVIRIYRAPLDRLSRFHSSLFLRAFIIPYLCQTRELIGRRKLRETIETGEIIAVLQMIRKNYGIKRFNEFTFESIPQKIVSFPLEKGKKEKEFHCTNTPNNRYGPSLVHNEEKWLMAAGRPNLRNQLHDSGLHLERVAKQARAN